MCKIFNEANPEWGVGGNKTTTTKRYYLLTCRGSTHPHHAAVSAVFAPMLSLLGLENCRVSCSLRPPSSGSLPVLRLRTDGLGFSESRAEL